MFAGGIVLVSAGLALRSCSSFEEYIDVFNRVVLPASTKLVGLSESSLCFTVLAETPSALKELWNIYNSETLKNRLQNFLVSEEIKQLGSGQEIEVTVYIDEKEYRAAYLDLMFQKIKVSQNNFSCILTSERTGGLGLELRASLFIVYLGYNSFKSSCCLKPV